MRFHADLHVHSKHSRATSGDCDLPHLAYWAQRKGLRVLATGDFTHPAWMAELEASLVPAEPGLFRLKDELERAAADRLEAPCRGPVRFMLSVEISTIYKKADRTRKVHHLVYAPDFDAAKRVVAALAKVGNLNADGRPILGLDSRHLLEVVLESGPGSYLVPAHIWTPWFSVLGSKAGFDSVDACYGDLAEHVFALETGLSSDPAMNWRLSQLDRFRLVSNSDAHSPSKLGREANTFDVALDYYAIRAALETGEGFGGTVEFFPEEGKYHLDGHRKCDVRLEPSETRARGERCPVCHQPLTVGVLSRVEDLADRPDGARPEGASDFRNLVPLPEVLAELHATGPASKTVERAYAGLLARLGPELFILEQAPLEDVARVGSTLLAEALRRLREGRVLRDAGYDGEYGAIRLFREDELHRQKGSLFEQTAPVCHAPAAEARVARPEAPVSKPMEPPPHTHGAALDPEQRAAAELTEGPLLIVAGPGTGKTRTLVHRIAHLVDDLGVAPAACLSITFTRRAADEMRERLAALLGPRAEEVPVMTFHALGLSLLREHQATRSLAGEDQRCSLLATALEVPPRKALRLLAEISRLKRTYTCRARAPAGVVEPGGELERAWDAYQAALEQGALWDFDDLVGRAVELLEDRPQVLAEVRRRWPYLSIDEYQDVDERQYRLVRLLAPEHANVCAIGDPDQAIYGFRGADVGFFLRFREDYPSARVLRITRNYRSARTIVEAALQVIAPSPTLGERVLVPFGEGAERIVVEEAKTERAEAELLVHTIERMIGGSTFFSMDSGRVTSAERGGDLSFSDFAVLYRTAAQADAIREALSRSGMPFQRRSHARVADREAVAALLASFERASPELPLPERLAQAAAALRASPPAGEVDAALELLTAVAARAGGDAGRFRVEAALATEVDTWDPRAARISLLTLHAAKGLEFRVVFVVGCEDGLVPLRLPGQEPNMEEERRLFYVGMTRAKERLFLTRAKERMRHGALTQTAMSPFVREIAERLVELRKATEGRKAGPKQLKLF